MTRESVRERGRLLREAPGLVEPQRALFGHYAGRSPSRRTLALGLALYDAFGGARTRAHHDVAETLRLAPHIARRRPARCLDLPRRQDRRRAPGLARPARGRAPRRARRQRRRASSGCCATAARSSAHASTAPASAARCGHAVVDQRHRHLGRRCPRRARRRADAAGRCAAATCCSRSGACRSAQSVSLLHPRDRRPVFATPWEGAALVGTTDLDHGEGPEREPAITAAEVTYLIEALAHAFPRAAADRRRRHQQLRRRSPGRGRRHGRAVGGGARARRSRRARPHHRHRRQADDVSRHRSRRAAPRRAARCEALRGIGARGGDVAEPGTSVRLRLGPGARAGSLSPRALRERLLGRYGAHAEALVADAGAGRSASASTRRRRCGPSCTGRCATSRCAISTTCCCAARASACSCAVARSRCCRNCSARRATRSAGRAPNGAPNASATRASSPGATRCRDVTAAPDDLLLAIDCGTQSVRALLFDLERQPRRQVAGARSTATSRRSRAGWSTTATPSGSATAEACQQLWREHPRLRGAVRSVAVTTQRGTVVPIDSHGRTLAPAIVWLDQRRATRVPPLGAFWRAALRAAGAAGTVRHFQREAECNWWAENDPAMWARADKVLLVSGFLNWKLTGRFVDSVASQVGYLPFDFKRHAWAGAGDWKWQALALRREQLPELVPAGTVLGEVSAAAATATGIARGLPVIAAAADKACEVLGSGCIDAARRRALVRHDRDHQRLHRSLPRAVRVRPAVSGGAARPLRLRGADLPRLLDGALVQGAVRRPRAACGASRRRGAREPVRRARRCRAAGLARPDAAAVLDARDAPSGARREGRDHRLRRRAHPRPRLPRDPRGPGLCAARRRASGSRARRAWRSPSCASPAAARSRTRRCSSPPTSSACPRPGRTPTRRPGSAPPSTARSRSACMPTSAPRCAQ